MDRKWWTLIAVCIGTFMLLIDVTIVNVALPDIQTSLKSTFSDLQWVVDAYSLMLAAFLLMTGSLADLFGRRRVFVIGLCIFTASSLLSGLATTPLFLNLARGAQGVGAAAMFSTSLALLASSFRGRERGMAFGVWGTITGLAVAIGPVVGGALTTGFGWRWIFLVNVPIGVIGVIVTLLRVEESRQPGARRPDWLGALTFSGALAALVYALIQGESKGWTSNEILGCLVGAGILLLLFLIVELVQAAPMFDLSLFRNPTFAGGSIVAFSLSAGMFALLLYLTLYLQDVLGFSALETGKRLLFLSGGILLTSTLAGRLTTRVPIRLLIGPGLILVGVGLLLMRGLTAASGWEHLIPGFVVGGAGVGMINPPLASTAVGVVEPARAGMASGINSTFRQVGIATGIAGLGAIFSHTVRTKMLALLATSGGIPQPQAHLIAADVAQGSGVGAAIASAPSAARGVVANVVRVSFVGGLNQIFLIAAVLSFVAALLSLVLIRNKDFEASAAYHAAAEPAPVVAAGEPDPGALPPAVDPESAVAVGADDGSSAVAVGEPAESLPAVGGTGESLRPVGDLAESLSAVGDTGESVRPVGDLAESLSAVGGTGESVPAAIDTRLPDAALSADAGDDASGRRADEGAAVAAAAPHEPGSAQPATDALPEPEPALAEAAPPPAPVSASDPSVPAEPAAASPLNGTPFAARAANGSHVEARATEASAAAIAERSYAVALAAEQAQADCSSYIEQILARHHGSARAGATPLGAGASAGDAAVRAGELRDRLNDLADERRRLVGTLREHTQAVRGHLRAAREQTDLSERRGEDAAHARRDLYGLIAALATLTDEARIEATTAPAAPGALQAAGNDAQPPE